MHKYILKIPWWIRKIYSDYTWKIPVKDKTVFLTFDDGPHPTITPWVLNELRKYEALATFFCIGKNVVQYPDTYGQILENGHAVGNHTFSHLNGWETPVESYLRDVQKAVEVIKSSLFRPPYGRIKRGQARRIHEVMQQGSVKVVMWDVLSADFDTTVSPQTCAAIVLKHCEPGSVIVFHDSEKAFKNLQFALPLVLEKLKKEGYSFQIL